MKLDGTGADGGQKVESVLRCENQDEVFGRLLESLQHGVGGLPAGPVEVVDEEDTPLPVQRPELRPLSQEPHLLNGELPQRPLRAESDEVRMCIEQQRVIAPLLAWPFLALGDDALVFFPAEVVLLDLFSGPQQAR